ncbi:MAG: hypothetical protein R2695_05055 [Acidimicrobiales bacterium]
MNEVRIGLLGCGTVGGALAALMADQRSTIRARTGVDLTIGRIAVRDVTKARGLRLAPEVFGDDPMAVVEDPGIDVVVELIGGIELRSRCCAGRSSWANRW